MKHSQQRPFFQAATSERTSRTCNHQTEQADVTLQENRFRPCGLIAVIFALLFFTSCASLTPDRINVLAMIAGQAAQMGAQAWLRDHPDQRPAFDLVLIAINNFVRNGETNMVKYTELLESLPTSTLKGEAGEIYVTGAPRDTNAVEQAHIVIWDAELNKAVRVTGALEKPVREAIRRGLNRAAAPLPPPLPKRNKLPSIVPEGTPTPRPLPRFQPATPPVIIPEPTAEITPKSDAELDAEFQAIKARLEKAKAANAKAKSGNVPP